MVVGCGDPAVPLDVRLLLPLGNAGVWAPSAGSPGSKGLWLHLRLLLCRAIWAVACKSPCGESVVWQGVVAMVRAWVSRAIPGHTVVLVFQQHISMQASLLEA